MDWIAILSAVIVGLITAGFGWLFRKQSHKEHRETSDKIQEVHVLVNSRLSEALANIDALERKIASLER